MKLKSFLGALLVLALLISTKVYGAEYDIENYKIDATIDSNGDMLVEEYLTYNFDEDMNGVYRELLYKYNFAGQKNNYEPTSSRYQASKIKDIKVEVSNNSFSDLKTFTLNKGSNVVNGTSGVYLITDNSSKTTIKVYTPASEYSKKYIKYTYTIKDVAVSYNDYAEIYWNFLGKDWQCYIGNLEVNLTLPGNVNKFYGHTYANLESIKNNGNVVTMKVKDISSGTAVDMRTLFSNDNLVNISKTIAENYSFNTLTDIENYMAEQRKKYDTSMYVWLVYAASIIFAFIYLGTKASKYANTGKLTTKTAEIYTELPDKYELGEYNILKTKWLGFDDSKNIMATILELSNRKIIKLEALKKVQFFGDKYEYFVSIDITNPKLNDLTEYEIELINYIFNKKNGKTLDISSLEGQRFELNQRFKELATKYTIGNSFRVSSQKKNKKASTMFFDNTPKYLWTDLLKVAVVSALIGLINIFMIYPVFDKTEVLTILAITFGFSYMILLLIVATTSKVKDEYIHEYNNLIGLEKYLKEYSLIKERYPIELVLWEKYLVFATLFGIADKVAKEFKEELLKQGYDENYIYTSYPFINMGINYAIINSSIASSSASSSSSSGGYSGGGGGGGGRRWRWRRCFLN